MGPACLAEAPAVLAKHVARVVRAALSHDGPERVLAVLAGLHHLLGPGRQDRLAAIGQARLGLSEVDKLVRVFGDVEQHSRGHLLQAGVVRVQVHVVAPPHRPHDRPAALADDQAVAPAVGAGPEGVREALPVPVGACGPAGKLDDSRGHVRLVVQRGIDAALAADARPADYHRQMGDRLVRHGVVGDYVQFAHPLAVVAGNDDYRVVQHALVSQGIEDPPAPLVAVADAAVVAVDKLAVIVHRGDLRRLARLC